MTVKKFILRCVVLILLGWFFGSEIGTVNITSVHGKNNGVL